MNNKIILGLVFAATFSMFMSFNHSAFAGESFTCNPNSHHTVPTSLFTPCICDTGFVQNGGTDIQPICILAPVGGMGIPVDSTALLLAGVQNSALWMIPAIVIAGAGITIFKLKKNK